MHMCIDSKFSSKKVHINVCLFYSNVGEGMCMVLPGHTPYSPRRMERGGSPCLALLPK